ncbi:MAG: tetratricopeptide repeat protein [Nitrospira sp.]|nr:tetratricopeptide repeat protein [Nitrospira sp.]
MSLDEEIMSTLPERVEPHLFFADYLRKIGKEEMAGGIYLNALEYIINEPAPKPFYFHEVYRFFEHRGLHGEALKVMQKAVEFFPEDLNIRLLTAAAYEKVNMMQKAVEEYEKVLGIDPNNERAKKRLKEIREKILHEDRKL